MAERMAALKVVTKAGKSGLWRVALMANRTADSTGY